MKDIFRHTLSDIKPYVQGKPAEAAQREFGLERIEKLASNENQFGPSPKAVAAIKEELDLLNFYPEGHPFDLIEKLSEKTGLAPECFSVGNGGESLIWYISMVLLDEGDEIVTAAPTFDIYRLSASYLGAKTIAVPLKDAAYDIDAMLAQIGPRTKIFWLANPNNPTGHIANREQLRAVVSRIPEDVVLVMDEAYYDFAALKEDYPSDSVSLLKDRDNAIILRSFSKVYGLAGLRIGYLMTSPELAAKINAIKLTFGVNRLAQAGAKAALDDDEYLRSTVLRNKESVDFLESWFRAKGWDFFPSYANFCWVNCGEDSRLIFEALQRKGVIIRPGFLWGWDTWLRVSAGTEEQMRFFAEKTDEILSELHE
ncbi:MAG: histidinol-phosphate transaminase [Clostridiales Family XIII bacterium]|jgi:histidinol-phosphate aminotransferase|nr:histidinol-phosphate transaminase [Clostridiales Family XIII bacterium]